MIPGGINMAAAKERQFTVRMDEATYQSLLKDSVILDASRSDILRACYLNGIHQIKKIRGLLKTQLEDISNDNEEQ